MKFLKFPGHRAEIGMGPTPIAAFAAQPTWCTASSTGTGSPLCAAHEPARPVGVQCLLDALECTRERLGSLGIRWSTHNALPWHDWQQAPSGQTVGGALLRPCGYPTHRPGKKMRAAGYRSGTAMRWWISPVGDGGAGWLWWAGKLDHASLSFFEVGGYSWTYRGRKGKAGQVWQR
jgi:hypothetical protein